MIDVVSADHTAHGGVWHETPATSRRRLGAAPIYRNIRMPGDFAMTDLDDDGDLDWVGTSMTEGTRFIVEQVATHRPAWWRRSPLPDGLRRDDRACCWSPSPGQVPVTGMPIAMPAMIENADRDGDGELDVDQVLAQARTSPWRSTTSA